MDLKRDLQKLLQANQEEFTNKASGESQANSKIIKKAFMKKKSEASFFVEITRKSDKLFLKNSTVPSISEINTEESKDSMKDSTNDSTYLSQEMLQVQREMLEIQIRKKLDRVENTFKEILELPLNRINFKKVIPIIKL